MCGIAGILGLPDGAVAERMGRAMAHRGPDDSGLYEDQWVALSHRRLSVLDLSSAGRQPMSRAGDRLWIVYNGEIYNYREIRRELDGRGHHFRSATDTEVILALYEDMGPACVTRLRGMFAFAIWDRRAPDPTLFLARDHFGVKPLVYATRPDRFVFASDLPGLLASGLGEPTVDPVSLAQYLLHGHVVQPRTILEGVSMLPAGHALTARPGHEPRLWRYWDLDHERCVALSQGMALDDQAARLRHLLEAAARSQMVSDVPLGAFLSGGIDSSTLVALMTRVSGRPVHTFSVGFSGSAADRDESSDALRSAKALGTVHQTVPVTGRNVAEVLPDIAARLGQPSVDGANMYFVSRAARRAVTVALAGMGGDELFAGYPWFRDLASGWSPEGRSLRPLARALSRIRLWRLLPRSRGRERWEMRGLCTDLPSHYMVCHMIRPPSEVLRLLGTRRVEPGEMFCYPREDDPRATDAVARVSRLDSKLYMCSQLLRDTDAASMAHSLEVRVPFLDLDVAEFAYGLPGSSKLGPLEEGGPPTGKRVLIRAVRDLIPEWTYRKPKRGFTMPFEEWLRGPLRDLAADALADRSFRWSGLVDSTEIDRTWRRFQSSRDLSWTRVWTLLMLALWWSGLRSTGRKPDEHRAEGLQTRFAGANLNAAG
jgi:asparagine synthase (glutamine-hydrolysing)